MIQQTINNFGKKIGLDDLAFNENKIIHLTLETIGELYFEENPPHLLLYLIKKIENSDLKVYQKILTLCHFKQKNPYPTFAGLYENDNLAFLVKIPYEQISESNIEKSIAFLNKLHEQVADLNKK
ncbi:MAG: hypothetical protein C5B43_00425 [Verrucomicrobia bacterium]|nr:MAG: hypothetical protein C5B43_00425 [Verrucomicrobiota bacterium]